MKLFKILVFVRSLITLLKNKISNKILNISKLDYLIMKKYIILLIIFSPLTMFAQSAKLHITGGNVNATGNTKIVLHNAQWINDGTFDAGTAEVDIRGDLSSPDISGTSSTMFYDLRINETGDNARLGQDVSIENELALASGKLQLGDYNLNMSNTATFANINENNYIQTDGTGVLIREVGSDFVFFPVGNSTFNPARLKNDGIVDEFNIRVQDVVYEDGTSGDEITEAVVLRTWLINEGTAGDSDVTMRLIWKSGQEDAGFDPLESEITHYTNGEWGDQTTSAALQDTDYADHSYQEAGDITDFSPFAVKSGLSFAELHCPIPTNEMVTLLAGTTASFTWDPDPSAVFHQVWYRIKGADNWMIVSSTNPQRTISTLVKNKYYQFKIRSKCDTDRWSDFTEIGQFYTSTCAIPTGVASIYLDSVRVKIRWDNDPNVYKNRLRYRKVGTATWLFKSNTPGNNFIYLTGLDPNSTYEYRVRARCNNDEWSAYDVKQFFNTDAVSARVTARDLADPILYPNPARGKINIEFEMAADSDVRIVISDMAGKVLKVQHNFYSEGMKKETFDISNLSTGYYLLSMYSGDDVKTMKFVVQR
ncbi:MAG: hypothetical protein ACI94Y_002276 [Maribacter sp.]|jgi:hypothetical protein